jgi:hypothetical protein
MAAVCDQKGLGLLLLLLLLLSVSSHGQLLASCKEQLVPAPP